MDDANMMATLAEASPPPGGSMEQLPAELREDDESALQKIKRVDRQREGFPGEHWLVLALGVAVWHYTRRNRHVLVRTAGSFAATALVARAASGRDGLGKVLRWTPLGRGIAQSCPPCDEAGVRQRR
jgi:hypothetical protein